MTKSQLIKTLEPFEDEVQILFYESNLNRKQEPRIFYYFNDVDDAQILLTNGEPHGKSVELKVRG